MNADPNPAKAIFLEAVERHAPDQWPAFLDRACAGQPDLRGRVEALLEAHREVGTAHHRELPEGADPGPVAIVDEPPMREQPGTVIGPYKLLEQIGEGGMGTVWMAQQTEPVKRLVALKLIKAGMDSKQVIARFEAERQALALMDHPNIARVLDAGTTDSGRPYFVMELVKGVPITSTATSTSSRRASGWSCSSRSARRCSTPTRRGSSTAISSRPTCWSPSTTASRCRRSSTSAWPRRPGSS